MVNTPHFEIKNLTLERAGQRVLDRVNMQIFRGEIVCLIGPSGSGKSSLLRCLNRLTEPPLGSVFINGQDVTTLDVLDLRRRIGMVFQQVALFDGTVGANITYGPALQNHALAPDEIERLMALVDLPYELADHNSQQLSGGQGQQRCTGARACYPAAGAVAR